MNHSSRVESTAGMPASGADGSGAAMAASAATDTVAAICTAPGAAGLAVLRVSGPAALAIADRVFRGATPLAAAPSHTIHHGWAWSTDGARLDELIAAIFRAPRSYTGEDVVELSCHGGRLSAARVEQALIAAGARPARAGEFTLRAFLNGRIDLAQAEAVADVIHAESSAAHELALGQLAGALSREIGAIADRVLDALAEVEARVDFAEDVGGIEVPPHVIEAIVSCGAALDALLQGALWGRALREGVRLPLVGRPNAGKSSLFNALLGAERAIVTDLPGTTRDRVSERIEIAGAPVTLSDTAGLREARDQVEAIGVDRTWRFVEESRAALWVVDGSEALGSEDHAIVRQLAGKRVVAALNKRDLAPAVEPDQVLALLREASHAIVVGVSAKRGEGLERLKSAVAELLVEAGAVSRPPLPSLPAVSNPRHVASIEAARAALSRARRAAESGEPGECVALELREALGGLGEITGRNVDDEVLDRIFGRFCIGK